MKRVRTLDLIGARYGRLVVLALVRRSVAGAAASVLAQCDCGNTWTGRAASLLRGGTTSCGCWQVEVARRTKTKHGYSYTRVRQAWANMVKRCTNPCNPSWPRYGGRGITVSDRWLVFDNFLADMGPPPEGLTLERKNNNKGYCLENCVWATTMAQNNNRSCNRRLCFQGVTRNMAQWADSRGMRTTTLWNRLNQGWTVERAITTPVQVPVRK